MATASVSLGAREKPTFVLLRYIVCNSPKIAVTMKTPEEKEVPAMSQEAIRAEVEKHTQAAVRHEEAAAKHRAAAAKFEAGDLSKASELAAQAHKHTILQPVYDPEDRNRHAAM